MAHQACLLLMSPTSFFFLTKLSIHFLAHRTLHGAVRPFVLSTPHLPPQPSPRMHAPPCAIRFSLLPIARAHLRLLLLAPAVPPAPLAHAPSGAPLASAGARGALACLRLGRSPAQPRAPINAAHASGARSLLTVININYKSSI